MQKTIPLNNDQKAMMLNISLSAFDGVLADERPGSARHNRAARSRERIAGLMDLYRKSSWPKIQLAKADRLMDEFNAMLQARFGSEVSQEVVLHIGLSVYEQVRCREQIAESRRLLGAGLDSVLDWLDIFRLTDMPPRAVLPAVTLGDAFEARVREVF